MLKFTAGELGTIDYTQEKSTKLNSAESVRTNPDLVETPNLVKPTVSHNWINQQSQRLPKQSDR